MRRMWCLAVLVGLSLWAAGTGAFPHAPGASISSSQNALSILDHPSSSDDTSDRHWAAVPPAACPAGSTWTSQAQAVLARARCHSMAREPREADVATTPSPRALRRQFQIPLLI